MISYLLLHALPLRKLMCSMQPSIHGCMWEVAKYKRNVRVDQGIVESNLASWVLSKPPKCIDGYTAAMFTISFLIYGNQKRTTF